MKKLLIVMGLVLVATLAFAGMAFANAGPHGGYDADTAACAGCHRAHTAVSDDGMLLKATNEYALCTSCHGQGASGTNVIAGTYGGSGTLNGGAFVSMGGVNVTSAHNVDGLNGGTGQGTAWGSGQGTSTNNIDGRGVTGTLECTSCHNPHGSTNYRILKDGALGHGDTAETIKWVSGDTGLLSPQNNQVLALAGASYTATTSRMQAYTNGINDFCANCHEEYLTKSGSRKVPSTTTGGAYFYPGTQDASDGFGNIARFRHTTSMTRDPSRAVRPLREALLSITSDPASTSSYGVTCLSCHYAHGTTAAANSYAANVQPTNDSALLFYNNRGVCQACHNKQ